MAFDSISEHVLRTALASPNRGLQEQAVVDFFLRQARVQDAIDALDSATATTADIVVALQTA